MLSANTQKCKVKICDRLKKRKGFCFTHYMRVRAHGHPQASRPIGFMFHGQGNKTGDTPEYHSWCLMRQRCQNPNNQDFKNYAGRGIKICKRWQFFQNFFIDMGKKPAPRYSLDRKDNNKGYSKANCRWATPKQQANNRRLPNR